MRASDIRNTFIKYFKDKEHLYLTPSNLVNYNDPELMFTNAGMNQLKKIFLGQARIQNRRLVNSQPCLRSGQARGLCASTLGRSHIQL